MKRTIFWAYSLWFRYAGLAMAILSGCVSIAIAVDIAIHGYVLVNGQPSRELASIAGAVGIPLIGVVLGMAQFYFSAEGATERRIFIVGRMVHTLRTNDKDHAVSIGRPAS